MNLTNYKDRTIRKILKEAHLKCLNCKEKEIRLSYKNGQASLTKKGILKRERLEEVEIIAPLTIKTYLNEAWNANRKLFKYMFEKVIPEFFFIRSIAVTPNKFRPLSKGGNGDGLFEDSISKILRDILKSSDKLMELSKTTEDDKMKKIMEEINIIQQKVASLHGTDKTIREDNKKFIAGIKHMLEKKTGLIRNHVMGKRVNFSGRSVISPDPYLLGSQVGIPEVFAKKLTYTEYVTSSNIDRLKKYVINGPFQYPGATHIQNEKGELISLEVLKRGQRMELASKLRSKEPSDSKSYLTGNNKAVLRHLIKDDILLLNRQPTLHKTGMMAVKASILYGERTIRFNYANCSSFNADFDGDEMNIHLPQNELARAEGKYIAASSKQYFSATSGAPLRGLIQDFVISGVLGCMKDRFYTKEVFCQILYCSVPSVKGCIDIPIPSIIRPTELWTGKQMFTSVISAVIGEKVEFTMEQKCKLDDKVWPSHSKEEGVLTILDGEVICGVIDKANVGATCFGLFHIVHEIYGADKTDFLMGAISRLGLEILARTGFSTGLHDISLTKDGNTKRMEMAEGVIKETIRKVREHVKTYGHKTSDAKGFSNQCRREIISNPSFVHEIEGCAKQCTGKGTTDIIEEVLTNGLIKPFPQNSMAMMIYAGAKGSKVNFSQMAGTLGQQELEGRRVPRMVSGKTLPVFKSFEENPRADGYIPDCFLNGVRPESYYFHTMAGREGLVDTSVKTSKAGYLQRSIGKGMEGVCICYDNTVRAPDGSIIQFRYGGDSLDPSSIQQLYNFNFFLANLDMEFQKKENEINQTNNEYDLFMKGNLGDNLKPSSMFLKKLDKYIKNNITDPEIKKKFHRLLFTEYFRRRIQPGEGVGIICSQAIGEPATQLTLNTFHLAGAGGNVTLGLPRLQEMLMTAGENIKTKLTTASIHPEAENKIKTAKYIEAIKLEDIITELVVEERFEMLETKNTWDRCYKVSITIFSSETLKNLLNLKIENVLTKTKSIFLPKMIVLVPGCLIGNAKDIVLNYKEKSIDFKLRTDITLGSFDVKDVVEKMAAKTVIRKGSSKVSVVDIPNGERVGNYKRRIALEGDCIAMLQNSPELFDFRTIYSNEMHSISRTYGIEATNAVIIKEIKFVFNSYGIKVDERHLKLLADFMTFEGVIKGFSRHGIKGSESPFQKIGFENAMASINSAALTGSKDTLEGPSGCITIGENIKFGTGMFDIIQELY
eukprot:GHVP01010235.1.p1 GENE.GHVP01010235.1~~GHVP01010235.1.p1  ORF type:complete len:1410 (+),score=263.86 GHVP01010235.1:547-4230(+)